MLLTSCVKVWIFYITILDFAILMGLNYKSEAPKIYKGYDKCGLDSNIF